MSDRMHPAGIDADGVPDGYTVQARGGVAGWAAAEVPAPQSNLPEMGVLALTAFTSSEQKARMLTSSDAGNTFTELVGSSRYADLDSGVAVRDASITRFAGRYLMAYTRAPSGDPLGTSTTWGLAESDDLLTFTRLAVITPPSPAGIQTLWAPDLLVDGDRLYAYWSVRTTALGTNHQTYVQYATAADLASWSTPTLVSGLGSNVIDTTVVLDGAQYVAIFKNEDTAQLFKATADNPTGPFTADASPLPTGGTDRVEGPSLLRMPSGGWRLIYDPFDLTTLRYIESDDLNTWAAPVEMAMPETMRHPDAIWLSHAELAGLRAQWTGVRSIVEGANVTVDNTDPLNPVVSGTASSGGSGGDDEVLVASGVTPPEPLVSSDGFDWLYGDVASQDTTTTPSPTSTDTVPAWAGTRSRQWSSALALYNEGSDQLRQLRKAVAAGLRGNADCRLVCIGDSKTAGFGTNSGGRIIASDSYPGQLRDILGVGEGLVYANTFHGTGSGGTDTRWTIAGDWHRDAAVVDAQSHYMIAGATGATMTLAVDTACTGLRIFAWGGTLNVTIDGAAQTSMVASGGGEWSTHDYTGLSATQHTIVLAAAGANVALLGVEPLYAAPDLKITNAGVCSSTSDAWRNWASGEGPNSLDHFVRLFHTGAEIAADAALVNLGTNPDALASLDAAIFDVSSLLPTLLLAPGMLDQSATNLTLRDWCYDLADKYDLPLLDLSALVGDYATANGYGYTYDTLHENARGYGVEAAAIARVIVAGG